MPAVVSAHDARPQPDAHAVEARRLWVAWQHPETRAIQPVACLALLEDGSWLFWYVRRALSVSGFRPFAHFPDLGRTYHSPEIFPMFANRVMSPQRPDYAEFLANLDLETNATPFDILARSSGRRATDSIRVYPEPAVDAISGITTCVFLAHGVRHIDGATDRIAHLHRMDRLTLRPERENPVNPRALLLDASTGEPVGYVPDLLLDYTHALLDHRGVEVRVYRVNPPLTPPNLQLLCWMAGPWPAGPRPFTGADYEPINASE